MQYRVLGKTGVEVSALGFGCMRLPTLGAPDHINEEAATELLREAIVRGVNYIDTAWFYHAKQFGQAGESEPFVGRALSDGWRDRVHLATKLPQQIMRSRSDMDRFLSEQLERLQTDHIDFYLVHGVNGVTWNRARDLGVREFLDRAREQGLIRHVGFSFHGAAEDFPRIIEEYDSWEFVQIQFNYMDIDYQAGRAGLLHAAEKGLGVIVMEPLKGGRLAVNLPPEMQAVFDERPEHWSAAEWALRYIWNEPGVGLLLSGMNAQSQLHENLRVAEEAREDSLAAEQTAVLATAREKLRSRMVADCSACRYCQPCPYGVQIPEVLSALNASAMWDTSDPWATGFSGVTGTPDMCTDCGQCEQMCPQGLSIRTLLKDAKTRFAKR